MGDRNVVPLDVVVDDRLPVGWLRVGGGRERLQRCDPVARQAGGKVAHELGEGSRVRVEIHKHQSAEFLDPRW
jgi:hypothetical protein